MALRAAVHHHCPLTGTVVLASEAVVKKYPPPYDGRIFFCKLPSVVASRSPEPQVIQLVVKMEIRRSKRILLSLIDPLPPVPIRKPRIRQNTIKEALKIKAFISDGPTKITWAQARKRLDISESKLAHLLKIVNNLPPDFIEDMRTCDDQEKLKIFTHRRLLEISRLRTKKERQNEIERLLPKDRDSSQISSCEPILSPL